MKTCNPILQTILFCLIIVVTINGQEPIFKTVKVDGPVHDPENHSYWFGPFSECASVLDVDGDGDLDITAGRNWYEAPEWQKHEDFRNGAQTNGPETDNNSEFAMDVNFDGWVDVVSSGWMLTKGAFWYENPGKREGVYQYRKWKGRRLHLAYSTEGVVHGDIDGDGDEDILVNHWANRPGQGVAWLEHIDKAPWFKEHIISTEYERHGNGLGDIDGDGDMDAVTPAGWYENPGKITGKQWTLHKDYQFENYEGADYHAGSHPMLVYDVNEDGLNDVIIGSAHHYGLGWFEQAMENGKRTFKLNWIEKNFSQFHTMAMDDLNGDGKPDLVTGKRLFAHHGRDIGAFEPLFVFWYDIKSGEFERHILSFNHLPWSPDEQNHNPPPNYAIGIGMKINIADMDDDGRNDVVLTGKSGLYIMYNQGIQPTPGRAIMPEEQYPSWRQWPDFKLLFNGMDLEGWQTVEGNSWVVEAEEITLIGPMDTREHNKEYLWTDKQYGNFILDLEVKIPERANSGIFLRTSDLKDPVQTGIEVQIGNSYGKKDWTNKGCAGAIYDLARPSKNPVKKAGEWNNYRITCSDNQISVVLNGVHIVDMDLDEYTTAGKNPDGSKNKFNRALKDFARKGYVGIQHHGRPVWVRNVMIKEIVDTQQE